MKKIVYLLLGVLISISLFSCSNSINRKGRAELIVIGMDYENADAAPTLSGTIDDAMEITAAFKNLMNSKGIDFSYKMLVQSGYDTLVKIKVTSYSALDDTVAAIMQRIVDAGTTSVSAEKTDAIDATITAYMHDMDIAKDTIVKIEALYKGTPALAKGQAVSLRDTPTYPSKENIEKTIRNVNLGKDDLLIVYYTGHGETYDIVNRRDLEKLLNKYTENGSISNEIKQNVLNLDIYGENEIVDYLRMNGVKDEIAFTFQKELKREIIESRIKEGALITAPTSNDPFYGLFNMERMYDLLATLPCKTVVITDACYSGFLANDSFGGVTAGKSFANFMSSAVWPNVISMAASTDKETSKVTVVRTEEGKYERHSAFTIEVLSKLGWVHTDQKFTYLPIPSYDIDIEGNAIQTNKILEVKGYNKSVPQRQTAESFYKSIMENWYGNNQTPVTNKTVMDIYIIP